MQTAETPLHALQHHHLQPHLCQLPCQHQAQPLTSNMLMLSFLYISSPGGCLSLHLLRWRSSCERRLKKCKLYSQKYSF